MSERLRYDTFYTRGLHDKVSLNHCFYTHMHEFDYLFMIDIDEVMVPRSRQNLSQLIRTGKGVLGAAAGICFQHIYFFGGGGGKDDEDGLYFMNRNYRSDV